MPGTAPVKERKEVSEEQRQSELIEHVSKHFIVPSDLNDFVAVMETKAFTLKEIDFVLNAAKGRLLHYIARAFAGKVESSWGFP
jgi:hypothetical protein